MTLPRVGVIGLGLMGQPISRNIIQAGYEVVGYDTDVARRLDFAQSGGHPVESIRDAVSAAPVVVLSLPHGGVVRDVCLGTGGVREHAAAGTIIIDTSTGRPSESAETAGSLEPAGVTYLDVTVSGTSRMAAERDLVAMVGGRIDAYNAVRPVLAAFTRSQHHLGPVGAGSQAKLVVNLVVGVSRAVLGEALVLGEQAGLDTDALLDLLGDSLASSRVLEVYGQRLAAGDHTDPSGRLDVHAKTIGLILESGRDHGAPLWFTEVAAKLLRLGQSYGMGSWDSTASVAVLRRLARYDGSPPDATR
jgi:2-hydroxy-3-oxopropionate reductase